MIIFDTLGSLFGPIFGVIIADFYLIKKQKINHKELFYPEETTEYIYTSGWNYRAIYALMIGFIFSASTIWNVSLNSFQSFFNLRKEIGKQKTVDKMYIKHDVHYNYLGNEVLYFDFLKVFKK